jgi:hypothetical protein
MIFCIGDLERNYSLEERALSDYGDTNRLLPYIGIFEGAPVVEDAPQPSKVFLKLELLDAIYPRAKSMQRMLMESTPVRIRALVSFLN